MLYNSCVSYPYFMHLKCQVQCLEIDQDECLKITKRRPQDWMEVALQGDIILSEALCSVAASSYGMTHA